MQTSVAMPFHLFTRLESCVSH